MLTDIFDMELNRDLELENPHMPITGEVALDK